MAELGWAVLLVAAGPGDMRASPCHENTTRAFHHCANGCGCVCRCNILMWPVHGKVAGSQFVNPARAPFRPTGPRTRDLFGADEARNNLNTLDGCGLPGCSNSLLLVARGRFQTHSTRGTGRAGATSAHTHGLAPRFRHTTAAATTYPKGRAPLCEAATPWEPLRIVHYRYYK